VRASSGDTDADDGLALTLSASDALAMVGLEAAKSAIRVVLNVAVRNRMPVSLRGGGGELGN
jgi:hypothetical protein